MLLAEAPLQIPGNLHQFSDCHNLPDNIITKVKHLTMQDPGTVTTQPFRKADLDRFSSLETIQIYGNKDLSPEAFAAMIDRKSGLSPSLRKLVFGPDWLPRFVELHRLLGKSVVVQGLVRFAHEAPGTDAAAAEVGLDRVSIRERLTEIQFCVYDMVSRKVQLENRDGQVVDSWIESTESPT